MTTERNIVANILYAYHSTRLTKVDLFDFILNNRDVRKAFDEYSESLTSSRDEFVEGLND